MTREEIEQLNEVEPYCNHIALKLTEKRFGSR